MWTFIAYQESCSEEQLHLVLSNYAVAISPLHDKDVDKDGVIKKAHWHIVVQTPINEREKKKLFPLIGMSPNCPLIKVRNNVGMLEYLTHESKSSTDKHTYSKEDIWYSEYWDEKAGATRNLMYEGYDIIKHRLPDVTYEHFVDYLFELGDEELLNFCFIYDMKFKHLIESMQHERQQSFLDKIDKQRKQIESLEKQIVYLTWDCPFAE